MVSTSLGRAEQRSGPRGSAADGDFSYTILPPQEPDVAAVGIYFLEGRVGHLYCPLERDEPYTYPNVSAAEFGAAVLEDHGITFGGFGLGAEDDAPSAPS